MGWLIALSIVAILCALVLFLPVRVVIKWYKLSQTARLRVYVKIGFIKIKLYPEDKKKPPKEKKDKPKEDKPKQKLSERIKGGISLYRLISEDVKEILAYTAKKAFLFEKIHFGFTYGTSDAASTGVLYGVISGIVYSVIGILTNSGKVKKSKISINPDFHKTVLQTKGECIVRLRNVHIIVILVKLIKLIIKIKKGKESDENGRTSNSRADGHSND